MYDQIDASQIEVGDQAFIEKNKPELEKLEVIRQAKLKIYNYRKKIAIPVAVIGTPMTGFIDFWLLFLRSTSSDDSAAGLTLAFLGALYMWVTQPKREYKKEYKKEFLPKIAKLFGNLKYQIDGKIPMGSMKPSKIVPKHDKYKSEDHFSGEYKGVDVQVSEIKLKKKKRSGKRTRYVTVFKGLGILLEIKHKKFYGHTILDKDKGALGEWFQKKSTGLKRAKMVDPEFEKYFDAYTNDQVEARYLVDPLMIERLNGLYQEYNGEQMAVAFYDNKFLILIVSKHNHFEPADLHVPATNPESLLNMKRELGEILAIVDKLSLYDPKAVDRSEELKAVEA